MLAVNPDFFQRHRLLGRRRQGAGSAMSDNNRAQYQSAGRRFCEGSSLDDDRIIKPIVG